MAGTDIFFYAGVVCEEGESFSLNCFIINFLGAGGIDFCVWARWSIFVFSSPKKSIRIQKSKRRVEVVFSLCLETACELISV